VKERMNTIENQDNNLESLVQLKIYSFAHYLRNINFKGYAKWCILHRTLSEEHPNKKGLLELLREETDPNTGKIGKISDEIYNGLLSHYQEKFMMLTKSESKSIMMK
jgi:hypothetical protein